MLMLNKKDAIVKSLLIQLNKGTLDLIRWIQVKIGLLVSLKYLGAVERQLMLCRESRSRLR